MVARFSSKSIFFIFGASLLTWLLSPLMFIENCHADSQRGIKVAAKTVDPKQLPLYEGSYALLIGVSDYQGGWPDLKSIPGELDRVEKSLQRQGFHVRKIMNPDSKALSDAFEEFIDQYGFDPNNRLLFFFSGHGHTRKGGEKGYLVPVDAPDPRRDERGFLRKALPMTQILSWSRQMEAKHALFLFDSCFSGTVFKVKAIPGTPPHINRATSLPVRQYITAGDAGDTVPASSVFTPAFIDALAYGWADLNADGYVCGTELGIYLQEKVPQHTAQTPQYGKIQDYKLSRGDFVFVLRNSSGRGVLKVETVPKGGGIWVDGRFEGISPVEITGLCSGRVTVEVKKKGYETWKERVLLREDHPLELKPVLKCASSGGTLEVRSDIPQARWYLDDLYAGRTPDIMQNIVPGTHRVTVKEKGYQPYSELIRVNAGQTVHIDARLGSAHISSNAPMGRLFVKTEPINATIRIMNIKPRFRQGITLSPGSYHLEISADGYETLNRWINLSAGEKKHMHIELDTEQSGKSKIISEKSANSSADPNQTSEEDAGVLDTMKRAFKTWTENILTGPSGPSRDNRGDPVLDGGP